MRKYNLEIIVRISQMVKPGKIDQANSETNLKKNKKTKEEKLLCKKESNLSLSPSPTQRFFTLKRIAGIFKYVCIYMKLLNKFGDILRSCLTAIT
jgi:hypothetical protein